MNTICLTEPLLALFVRSSPVVIALGRTIVYLPEIGMLRGPGTRTDIDVTTITDPRKTVTGRTIGVDLKMTAPDISRKSLSTGQ